MLMSDSYPRKYAVSADVGLYKLVIVTVLKFYSSHSSLLLNLILF